MLIVRCTAILIIILKVDSNGYVVKKGFCNSDCPGGMSEFRKLIFVLNTCQTLLYNPDQFKYLIH